MRSPWVHGFQTRPKIPFRTPGIDAKARAPCAQMWYFQRKAALRRFSHHKFTWEQERRRGYRGACATGRRAPRKMGSSPQPTARPHCPPHINIPPKLTQPGGTPPQYTTNCIKPEVQTGKPSPIFWLISQLSTVSFHFRSHANSPCPIRSPRAKARHKTTILGYSRTTSSTAASA